MNRLFDADKPQTGVITEKIQEDITSWKKNSCDCSSFYAKTVRLKIIKKGNTYAARDYYSDIFYSIGELREGVKIGTWKTYCQDKKIIEEYWIDGNAVWMKKFDINGKLIEKLNSGHPAENF
jgi:hypothetical protein